MIVLLDNYDSFTYNLYQYIGELYPDIQVIRNDVITVEGLEQLKPEALIVSPGPGYPKDAGISLEAIRHFSGKIPILGVCLGHQSIAEAFGGKIVKASVLMHGKASKIRFQKDATLFRHLPEEVPCGRYHSLIVEDASVPECLWVTARDTDGQIMGLEHKELPIYGVQFHPESILTQAGKQILINFLNTIPGVSIPDVMQEPPAPKKALCPYSNRLIEFQNLTQQEAAEAMDIIMSGQATEAQIAEFLTALRMKGETIDEISGLALGMRAKANLVPDSKDAIDIVGTGGDLASSFNISTTASFVIAAAGVKVAKHGNRSVSSKSGAADVLECLGVKIQSTPEQAKACLDTVGVSFLFAQSYHKSMRFVAPVRGQMGVRTVFNVLGPLTNPAQTDYIVLGVYEKKLLSVMAHVLIQIGIQRAMVVYGNDRLDEVSISDSTSVAEVRDGQVLEYELTPEQMGLLRGTKEEIVGGTAQENADVTKGILNGSITGSKRNIVLLNAGCALYTIGKVASVQEGVSLAAEMIDSGKALEKLQELVTFTNR
ncbi:MAG: bifunctional anthranilate synthase component II/anthranilate phosphoribosyltransferase [Ruminococcus sp.]|nr:bifunctional anthranilate synthase component II/anthranilate phosphoribosyltransferase [Ruminococcus sp.]